MKRLLLFIPVLFLSILVLSCKDKDKEETPQPTAKNKILVNYPWRMSTVTDLSGKTIPDSQLDTQTQGIKKMDIQFQQNATVRAFDQGSSQVVNGGTWSLINDEKTLDIKIIGFSGEFGLEELSNSTMKLKTKITVGSTEQDALMVFTPVIK
ncbi:hypothetical protein GCM10010967_17880 [Dyadobacter beijingensis]|uniref:Lipocalin-like domain-containing protein n=1 Tax=Dyadobacter beijingensis TaxID=365489 RepID=A0ABQ2HPC0_9BACT|nr:hypothetical protein [Dyadobacter beijingensis]GGM86108.1 hypothetical protein GCM10010967_17880 [Dyadobacter beijingensis]